MKIGIGITTKDRNNVFAEVKKHWKKYLPKGAKLVIVDDGGQRAPRGTTYKFKQNAGIARAKNKCIELLMDAGCDHIFLADDDVYPVVDDWHSPYIDSGIKHMSFTFPQLVDGRRNGRQFITTRGVISEYGSPCGCLLYIHRSVIETIGGFDVDYPQWGFEHVDFSNRCFNAGLTPHRYLDYAHSLKLFHSMDYHREIRSSVSNQDRAAVIPINRERFAAKENSKEYMPYKTPTDGVILAAYFNTNPDPQRGSTWEASTEPLQPLVDSCKRLGLRLIIFHDCLPDAPDFVKVNRQTDYSPNVYRWMVYKKWLEKNKPGHIFMVDSTDVEVLRNPFLAVNPKSIYVGSEFNMKVDNQWMRTRQEPLFDVPDYRVTILAHAREVLPNCGVVGGAYDTVMEYLNYREEYHRQYTKGILKSTDMAFFNYILWKHFPDRIISGMKVTTRFKYNETNNISWFKHK